MVVVPENPSKETENLEFSIEEAWKDRNDEYAIMLHVVWPPRPSQTICRMDVQDEGHHNPAWFSPPYVPTGVPHLHVYSPRAVSEDLRWSQCATPLANLPNRKMSRQQEETFVRTAFLEYLNIRFLDSPSAGTLFPRGV